MSTKQQDRLDRTEPALIVKYGSAVRKFLSLARAGTTLGRARGCDIELESPEVSGMHCLITRSGNGLTIRDCASRAGTRVNGERVKEAPLRPGDVVQIGPFSFEVYLPATLVPAEAAAADHTVCQERLQHLTRSRIRLARRALTFRSRLREPVREKSGDTAVHDVQAEALQQYSQELEQQARQLREAEAHFAAQREAALRELGEQQARLQQFELALTQRQQQAEADLEERWREFRQRCEERERALDEQARSAAPAALPSPEEVWKLDLRKKELLCYSRHLRRCRQRLQEEQQLLHQVRRQVESESRELSQAADRMAAARTELDPEPDEAQASAAALQEQRARLDAMLEDLQRLFAEARRHQAAELEALRQTREQLLQLPQVPSPEPAASPPEAPAGSEQAAELARLQEQVREKDALVQTLREQARAGLAMDEAEIESYETELNDYRRQLEAERQSFDEEVRQLKARNAELDTAAREMELELSRERARLSHERSHLDRLRAELQMELELVTRDPELRERLAPLQRTRPETDEAGPAAPTPVPGTGGRLADRLNSLLTRLADTSH